MRAHASASNSPAIALSGVVKSFGAKTAVDELDLVIPRGGLYGLLGPNGAGKTTSLRIVLAVLFADRGRVEVLGEASALEAKDRIGYLPEERGLYRKMKVATFLGFMGRLKGMAAVGLDRRVGEWLERVGLADVAGKRCEELSKGMQQKVQFVAAALHEPELLILDEPFSGLDPVNRRLLKDLILEQHRRGTTVVFSTHVLVQAEEICEHVVLIDGGRKVLDESLAEIRRRFDPRALLFEPLDPSLVAGDLGALPGVSSAERLGGRWTLGLAEDADPRAVMRSLLDLAPASRLELHRPTLEDIFVEIVTEGEGGEEARRARARLEADRAAPLPTQVAR